MLLWDEFTDLRLPWKRWLILVFTYPIPYVEHVRLFRFGIPWIVKIRPRTTSTETHALQFLESTGLNLPIPHLVFSFVECGATYTIMTRLPGVNVREAHITGLLTPEHEEAIVMEVATVLAKLDTLCQPLEHGGQVLMSTSGHDLPDPRYFQEARSGPFPSVLKLWAHSASYDDLEEFETDVGSSTRDILSADPVRFVHPDLRMYNVLVHNGHVSGIIDWEDSGWYPASWQVHTMRHVRFGCFAFWAKFWIDRYRFSAEAESAYTVSLSFLEKPVT